MYYPLAYIVLLVLIVWYLYYIVAHNRKIEIDAYIPKQGIVLAVFTAILYIIILARLGFGHEQLYLMLLLGLFALVYCTAGSGFSVKGVYHSGHLIKAGKIKFYALDGPQNGRYRVRVNNGKREIAIFIDEEQKNKVEVCFAGMGVMNFKSYVGANQKHKK